jgi:HlyD family secretion protein
MKNFRVKIKSYIIAHKIISTVLLIIIILVGYWSYGKITSTAGDTRYITAKVEKGTIIASISGSGQVSSLNQIDIKAKVSGDVVYLSAQNGQKIGTGGLIAQLDNTDAQKSVRDAEINLGSAQISLEKLKIQNSDENMNADLAKAYDDGFNTVSNVFLDLPGIMTGLNDMFFKSSAGTQQQWNIDWYEGQVSSGDHDQAGILKQNFIDSYRKAKIAYDANLEKYKVVSRISDGATIETLILQTYDDVKLISDAIKNANNYIDFVNSSIQKNNADIPALITTHKTSLNSYTSKTNIHLVNLLGGTTSIKSYQDAFPNSDLDIQSAELSVKQKENSLQDAKDKLADYFIRAPFAGTITIVNIKKGNTVSTSTVVATLITKTQLAEISFNEVDVAKIKIGQKATLTFDAVPDLTISGIVANIDTVGTISQGVVTYIVKISFDTQDERIKPSMSVSAAVITDIKQDVLVVPNSSLKSQGGISYVENFDAPLAPPTAGAIGSIAKIAPNKIPVEVGLSNDSQSEIISGIKEGDEIVTRTILPTAATTTATAPSLFGSPATNRGGNTVRIPTGR